MSTNLTPNLVEETKDTNFNNAIAVLSFYSFVNIREPELLLAKTLLTAKKKYIKGTVLISEEGFNGSICGCEQSVRLLLDEIIKSTDACDVNCKINYCDTPPFSKIKVKIKPEIISMRVGKIDVANLKGAYIAPKEWDEFIARSDVILVDTRNNYEVEIGTFKGAVNPNTDNFRDFPAWADQNRSLFEGKKIAMVCTGGIRCEKSTAYMKGILGYQEVYHLRGGILQYLEDTGNKNNLWQGECFVFDDRRAVTDDLSPADGYWIKRD